ncbi:hypothetical protein AB0M20_30915 [Actinoplanes sp. NPDC051633]|uniref:hypothetical protein n=1 Tax=Actinoplanes sp. NPDC051633 TaxID=3155670 RepID=UPI00344093FF
MRAAKSAATQSVRWVWASTLLFERSAIGGRLGGRRCGRWSVVGVRSVVGQ